jgi:hypothetical protein
MQQSARISIREIDTQVKFSAMLENFFSQSAFLRQSLIQDAPKVLSILTPSRLARVKPKYGQDYRILSDLEISSITGHSGINGRLARNSSAVQQFEYFEKDRLLSGYKGVRSLIK